MQILIFIINLRNINLLSVLKLCLKDFSLKIQSTSMHSLSTSMFSLSVPEH